MSRSAFIGLSWANGTNFPAGSDRWSATPLKVAPAGSYMTPRLAVAGQELNYILNAVTNDVNGLVLEVGQAPALNWGDQRLGPPGAVTVRIYSVCWEPVNRRWYCSWAPSDESEWHLQYTEDLGENWVDISTWTFGAALSLLAKGDGDVYAWRVGTTSVYRYNAYTDTLVENSTGTNCNMQVNPTADAAQRFLGRTVLFAKTSTGNAYMFTGTDFPTTQVTLPGSLSGEFRFCSAASSTRLVAFSLSDPTNYVTTDDGITVTSRTLPFTADGNIRSIAYSSVEGCWLIADSDPPGGSIGDTLFHRSVDGVSWVQSVGVIPGRSVYSIQVIGALWIALSYESVGTTPKIYLSTDKGATWKVSDVTLPKDVIDPGVEALWTRPTVLSSGSRFCVYNSTAMRFSFGIGAGY